MECDLGSWGDVWLSFEVLERDLLARIGRLRTKRGDVETPLLLPVVNPSVQPISCEELKKDFGCEALIANAYLLRKNFAEEVKARGVHDFLNFDRVVFTDSGAYQILVYGGVEATAEEMARFEEEIDVDVAVILDVPTGWNKRWEKAEQTVTETIRRARLTLGSLTRSDILWVGPVQGGDHLDLVARSASEIGRMPFQIYALGSPTQVMERYLFSTLVDMIVTAKRNLPVEKPLHLFGAGHPFMFSLAVALGCDIFDSAAYALFAREGKYMTEYGTVRLRNLRYFPCSCEVCSKHTPAEVLGLQAGERMRLLAWHNLGSCFAEIRRIKEAIREGRLWELLEVRCRGHPALLGALKGLRTYEAFIEAGSPVTKPRGLFYCDSTGLARPEVVGHRMMLREWTPPRKDDVLLLLPQPVSKPFHRSREYRRVMGLLGRALGEDFGRVHVCGYAAPFGVVPVELDEVYPLSQFESVALVDGETVQYVAERVEEYLSGGARGYKSVVLHSNMEDLGVRVEEACVRVCGASGVRFQKSVAEEKPWGKTALENLVRVVSAEIGAVS